MSLEQFKKSLESAPVMKKGDYCYFIHPITDGIPEIKPSLLNEVVDEIQRQIQKLGRIDKIVTMEAMGIPLATLLSQKTGIPFTIIRKRTYDLPGEICVFQKTGYSESKLYINGIEKKDKIIIVDDVLSTGGTLRAVLLAMKQTNIDVKGVFIAVYKGDCIEQIRREFSIPVTTLVKVKIVNDKVIIES